MRAFGPSFFFFVHSTMKMSLQYINTNLRKDISGMDVERLSNIISITLEELCISNCRGYEFLRDVLIKLITREYRTLYEAYGSISVKNHISKSTVESTVRRAIRKGIDKSTSESKVKIFGYDVTSINRCRNYYQANEFTYYLMNYILNQYNNK